MFADSMALRHSRESSTDREPKKFTSHCRGQTQKHWVRIRLKTETSNTLELITKLDDKHLYASYLGVEKVCVHHGTLDVVQICVVFQRPLQETSLLTQLCHVGPIVVGEHLVAQDGVCNLQGNTSIKLRQPN